MGLVTIPFDFDEDRDLPRVIPICVEDTDRYGRLINRGWLCAVLPIADPLRRLAHRVMGDGWHVSELAEGSVHAQWYEHGDDLGRNPSARIFAHATGLARDLKAGGRNARRGVEVELLDSVRSRLRALENVHGQTEHRELVRSLAEHFTAKGVPHVVDMLEMWLHGLRWDEIADHVGKKPKAATKDFWRWFQRASRELNLL